MRLALRVPRTATLAAIDIDDPEGMPATAAAMRVKPPRGAKANGHGPAEWQAPVRAKIRAVAAVRDDVAALMFARGQIDQACHAAARSYQQLFERAELVPIKTVDPSMPPSGTRCFGGNFVPMDQRRRAAERLVEVEAALFGRYGNTGVALVRDVLGSGKTIEAVAAERGDGADKQALKFWGSFFRRCLRALAEILGFVTVGAYGPYSAQVLPAPPALGSPPTGT